MKTRLAALVLALGFLAAPALALAAAPGCTPCCTRAGAPPCASDGPPCAELARTPCCTVTPAAPATAALRIADVPLLHGVAPACATSSRVAPQPPAPLHDTRTAQDPPRRLSVVRRQ